MVSFLDRQSILSCHGAKIAAVVFSALWAAAAGSAGSLGEGNIHPLFLGKRSSPTIELHDSAEVLLVPSPPIQLSPPPHNSPTSPFPPSIPHLRTPLPQFPTYYQSHLRCLAIGQPPIGRSLDFDWYELALGQF